MPATRRSSRGGAAKGVSNKQQSALSFNHKIAKTSAARTTKTTGTEKAKAPCRPKGGEQETEAAAAAGEVAAHEWVAAAAAARREGHDAEVVRAAAKMTDARITHYWAEVEGVRIAARVHQQDLSLAEKLLRYFDVSSQYGPCTGLPRRDRWFRAHRLGLNPPLEVLAVLLREEKEGNREIERAAMDRIMGSMAVGSA